jgi:hypothetical protein
MKPYILFGSDKQQHLSVAYSFSRQLKRPDEHDEKNEAPVVCVRGVFKNFWREPFFIMKQIHTLYGLH